jgi:hypothetical protein
MVLKVHVGPNVKYFDYYIWSRVILDPFLDQVLFLNYQKKNDCMSAYCHLTKNNTMVGLSISYPGKIYLRSNSFLGKSQCVKSTYEAVNWVFLPRFYCVF